MAEVFKFSLFRRIAAKLLIFALSIVAVGCGSSALEFSIGESRSLSGTFKAVSNPSSLRSLSTCATWTANLYAINSDGSRAATAIATAPVNTTSGFYEFSNLRQLGVPKDFATSLNKYLVRIEGCDISYERFVTDRSAQDVSAASDVVALGLKLLQAEGKTLSTIDTTRYSEIINSLAPHALESRNDAYQALVADTAISAKFVAAFGFPLEKVGYLPPTTTVNTIPSLAEGTSVPYGLTTQHWNSNYQTAEEWFLDGQSIGTTASGLIALNKNSQGSRVLKVVYGSRAVDGSLDSDYPVEERILNLSVPDTFPAVSPAIALVGTVNRNYLAGSVTLSTGASLVNCETFSNLAVGYDALVPPLNPADYATVCATSPTQPVPFLLDGADGLKTIALWARDSSGNISNVPSTVTVRLDRAAPTLTLQNLAATIAGNAVKAVTWTAADSGSGLQGLQLQFSEDGTTFVNLVDLMAVSSPWSWTVPAIDRSSAKLRLIATDNAGNSQTLDTASFAIDSTPPTVTITAPVAMTSSKTGVTLSGACESGLSVSVAGSGVAVPTAVACSSGGYSAEVTFTPGDGTKSVIVSQTDAVGNTGSATRDFVRDNVAPVVAIVSPDALTEAAAGLTVTGTCETGLSIALSGTGLASPASTPCTSGTFSVAVLFAGADGTKNIIFSQTDAAGNTGSVARDFVKDSAGPSIVITGPAALTPAQTGVTLTGTCEAGLSVALSGSGFASPSSTTCSSGTFSVPVTFSAGDGTKTITVTQTDGGGNPGSDTRNFVRDTQAPVLAFTAPAAMSSAQTGLTVTGTCETGLTIALSGTGLASPSSTPCASGTFSVAVAFTANDGTKTIVFSQTDAAGNTGAISRDFVRDNVGPTLTITSPADNSSTQSSITLIGTCEIGASNITISGSDLVSGATVACSVGGAFNSGALALSGADGSKTITITQNDAAGNTGSIVWHAMKDNVGPYLLKLTPADNTSFPTGATITGTCESGRMVSASGTGISGTPSDLCLSSAFSIAVSFTAGDGTKPVTLSQTDAAGNTTTLSFNLVRDSAPPALVIAAPAALTRAQTGVTMTGTCEGSLSIALSGSGLGSPSTTTCVAGNFSVAVTFTPGEGTKTITLSQTDAAGNTGTASRDFVRDQTPPNITVTSPADGSSAQASVTLTGACEDGLQISYDGTGINAAFSGACSGGSYSQVVFLKTDTDGSKQITVSQTDAAGNNATVTRTYIRDNSAPAITQTLRSFPYYTKVNTATFGGACENGFNINMKLNGTNEGTATCSSGSWSYSVVTQTSDGTYNYTAEQTDSAGNTGAAAFRWIRDTFAPSIAITAGANQLTASNSVTISGTCEAGLPDPIVVSGAASGTVACTSGSWSYATPTQTTDATRTYSFTLTDQAGNASTVSTTWERNTNVPNLLITTPGPIVGQGNTAGIAGNCENGLSIEVRVDGALETTLPCSGTTFSYTMNAQTTDADRTVVLKQTNGVNLSTTASIHWIRDNMPPVFAAGQMTLNSGTANTSNARVRVTLNAADTLTNITDFCLKTGDMATPTANASCWTSVAAPAVGLTPDKTLSLANFKFNLPITPETYIVYAWARDAAGNISQLTASGGGTTAQDKASITLFQAVPPTVPYVIVGSTDSPASPPSNGDLTVGAGSPIFIKWKATDNNPLPSNAVRILFTTDDTTYTLVASGLTNGVNGSCTVNNSSTTADDDATGCYRMSASPAAGYIKFRVIVTDSDALEGGASSQGMNVSDRLRFLAGNTDSGLNLSAQRAMFFYRRMSGDMFTPDPSTIAVTRDGTVFFKDAIRGILKVDPADGIVRVFIPAGALNDGPVSSATVGNVYKIALDGRQPVQRLWLWDYDRIRRVDLETNTITTIIGGPSATDDSDTVNDPLTAKVYPSFEDPDGWNGFAQFFATASGDLYFQAGNDGFYEWRSRVISNQLRLRKYDAATNRIVTVWRPTNVTAAKAKAAGDYNSCQLRAAFSLNPVTSTLVDRIALVVTSPSMVNCNSYGYSASFTSFDINGVSIDPSMFPGGHRPGAENNWWSDRMRLRTGLDGKIYGFSKEDAANGIYRYDGAPTYAWTKILGSSDYQPGTCADGTDALSCRNYTADVFVAENGTVYFLDDGMIRTITSANKVVTLMGQAQVGGIGLPSMQARLGTALRWFQVRNDGGIAFTDGNHHRIYELDPNGIVSLIAGNGSLGNAALNVDAKTTSLNLENPNNTGDVFAMDPATGEIFHHAGDWRIARLTRSSSSIGASGQWTQFIGSGSNAWSSPAADGTNNIYFYGDVSQNFNDPANFHGPQPWYLPRPWAFANGKILVHHGNIAFYNSTNQNAPMDNMLKLYSTTDGTQTHFAGRRGFNPSGNLYDNISAEGTLLSDAEFWSGDGLRMGGPVNIGGDRWLFTRYGDANFRKVYDFTLGGSVQTMTTLNDGSYNIAYRRYNSTDYIYYCATGSQKIIRRNVQTATETTLPWPVPAMRCNAGVMVYKPSTQSLVFAYQLNGVAGLAEYFDAM